MNFTLRELQNKVEKNISKYIEFDVNELFEVSDYITIYGGAVRDSIADMDIHDVDILCMPQSAGKLLNFLQTKYNYEMLDLVKQDTLNMYKGISVIAEPWTLMNDHKKIIQIIRPRYDGAPRITRDEHLTRYQIAYYNLIKNVDISCCGVFLENLDKTVKLREACKNGIINCLTKTFEINEWSILYNSNRTLFREHKLTSRGWKNINKFYDAPWNNGEQESLKIKRKMKVLSLEFKPEYDFKIWSELEYMNHVKEKEKVDNSIYPF